MNVYLSVIFANIANRWIYHSLFKNLSLPKDKTHPLIIVPYFPLLNRWQYDKVTSKFEFLFKEDMKRANESILERNKKYHETYIKGVAGEKTNSPQTYKVEVKNGNASQ